MAKLPPGVIVNEFKSSSSSKVYRAAIHPQTRATSCDCPGWIFQRAWKPRGCKHTLVMLNTYPPYTITINGCATVVMSPKDAQEAVEIAVAPATKKPRRYIEVDGEPAPTLTIDKIEKAAGPPPAGGAIGTISKNPILMMSPGVVTITPKAAFVAPMLASACPDGKSFADYGPWWMEPKYDGWRVVIRVMKDAKYGGQCVAAFTRTGNPVGLHNALPAELEQMPVGVYDGELHVLGGTSSDVGKIGADPHLALFDATEILGLDIKGRTLASRRAMLEVAAAHIVKPTRVAVVAAVPASMSIYKQWLAAGGEGAILKDPQSPYMPGVRTSGWIKFKKTGSAVCFITGYENGELGPFSVIKLMTATVPPVEVRVKAPDVKTLVAIRKAPSEHLGRRVVIEHNGVQASGKFRHPRFDHFAGIGEK